ncbi:hypothetical protein G3M55_00800, partial [Streptomyces sp. SID8455]|nr:hypothetical protein [Streptomyces sp. SID8455]
MRSCGRGRVTGHGEAGGLGLVGRAADGDRLMARGVRQRGVDDDAPHPDGVFGKLGGAAPPGCAARCAGNPRPAPGALAVGADVEDGGRALLGEGGEGGTPKGA